MNIKRAARISFATLVAILAVGWFASPSVQAHNALATPSCTGLAYSATNYDKEVTNTIVVKVDGTTSHQDLDFKASDVGSVAWSQTAAHSWSVVVNAPGVQFDRSFSGIWQACVVPPTTTVAPTTTQPATTTTVAEVTTTTVSPRCGVPDTSDCLQPTTTSVVAVDLPPVPCSYNPTVPAGSPLCVPPVAVDVVALTPAEPRLPITGLGDTVALIILALIMIGTGWYLARKGRRVP